MFKSTGLTAAIAAGALLVPAAAQADVQRGVASVKAHTTKADAALDRAVALYEADAAARGDRSLATSRREMAAAHRDAAKLRSSARTANQEAKAARAAHLVAAEQDENVEKLTGALDDAPAGSERKIASAAKADVTGREKALGVLTALLDEVPEQGRAGIAKAIVSLSTDRDDEVAEQTEALIDGEVGTQAKQSVADGLEANVEGQSKGAERLAGLIAGDDVPEQGKAGLRKAYDAVVAEHSGSTETLSAFADRIPATIRSFVEAVVTRARQDAQSMRDERPAPPSGQPEGTYAGQPTGTTDGQQQTEQYDGGTQTDSAPTGRP